MHDTIDLVFGDVSFVATAPTGNNAANPVLHQSQVPLAADPSRLYDATPTLALICDIPWALPRTGEGGKVGLITAGALLQTSLRGEFKARNRLRTRSTSRPTRLTGSFLSSARAFSEEPTDSISDSRLSKVNAEPRFEATWDSWLRPPFQFSKNRSPPAPACALVGSWHPTLWQVQCTAGTTEVGCGLLVL